MTLRWRLALGLVTIAIILVGPLVYAISAVDKLHSAAAQLHDRDFAASLLLGRLREGLNLTRQQELALLFTPDAGARNALERQVGVVAAVADSLKRFELGDYAATIAASVSKLQAAAAVERAATHAKNAKAADSASAQQFVPAMANADSVVSVAEAALRARTDRALAEQSSRTLRTETVSITAMVLALIVAAGIAAWLTRSITEPIVDLKHGMRAVADGDLDYRLKVSSTRADEFGQLATSFEEMTRQLGELDKLKAEFVSVASHELKTPINVIVGYLQLLEEGVYGPVSEKQAGVHNTLAVQANSLLRLVKQLLDVSRFEAGGGRVEPRRIVLAEMLSDLEKAFHVLAVQREVAFHVTSEPGLPSEVCWDLDRMNEVLGNLLSNAFKFTPRGGSVDLTLRPDARGVMIEVRDTGAGIAPDQLPRIFDKFYQADNQGAARAVGTGLGLAIAKQIVDAHGGIIACESTPGLGTTFRISLPTLVARRSAMQHPLPGAA